MSGSASVPRRRLHAAGFALAILLAVLGLVVTTGTSLLPPSLVLGPCLQDWTSANSYGRRASPLGSVRFSAGALHGELCYGRPSRRGRSVYGGLIPFDVLWRFGANEPTRLYLDRAAVVAGIPLDAGRYSLYVTPGRERWELFVSRSVLHWGNDISAAVRAREVGRASVVPDSLAAPVETLTVSSRAAGDTTWLDFDWERTRIALSIEPRS